MTTHLFDKRNTNMLFVILAAVNLVQWLLLIVSTVPRTFIPDTHLDRLSDGELVGAGLCSRSLPAPHLLFCLSLSDAADCPSVHHSLHLCPDLQRLPSFVNAQADHSAVGKLSLVALCPCAAFSLSLFRAQAFSSRSRHGMRASRCWSSTISTMCALRPVPTPVSALPAFEPVPIKSSFHQTLKPEPLTQTLAP
jgi:hypothetical protein